MQSTVTTHCLPKVYLGVMQWKAFHERCWPGHEKWEDVLLRPGPFQISNKLNASVKLFLVDVCKYIFRHLFFHNIVIRFQVQALVYAR